jgi:hypothetical protein
VLRGSRFARRSIEAALQISFVVLQDCLATTLGVIPNPLSNVEDYLQKQFFFYFGPNFIR